MKLKQIGTTWGKEREKRDRLKQVGRPESAAEVTIKRSVGTYLGQIGMKYGVTDDA